MAENIDVDNMSDEELMEYMDNLPEEEESDTNEQENVDEESTDDEQDDETQKDVEDTDADESEEEVADTEDADPETDETETDETDKESQNEEDDEDESNEDTEENDSADDAEEAPETNEPDYKQFYEQVTSEYKANGKMMPGIKDPEDFKRALSMASNYAQKTTAIKPHLGRIKALEKAGVTDDEFNMMMDLRNGDPEAIKKAMKDAKLDPMEIDIDEEVQYRANDHSISSEELEFDEIIDPIRDTPEFAKVTEVVTTLWDERSKKAMLGNPALIEGLHWEMANGRYETVQAQIEQRRLLGKTNGMSDLEMYQEIATAMSQVEEPKQTQTETTKPKVKVEDPALNEKRKKAGIKQKKKTTSEKKYDPTTLSDDEFMKLVESGATFIK